MKIITYAVLLVGLFCAASCSVGTNGNEVKTTTGVDSLVRKSATADPLYFQTDFSTISLDVNQNYIGFNPSNLGMPSTLVSECDIGFSGAIPAYANAEIVTDNNRNVLKGMLYGDDPNVSGTTRFQMDIIPQPTVNLPVYHFSYRMFIDPDLSYLSHFPNAVNEFGAPDWVIIFEVWNQFNAAWDGNGGGSARWDLSLAKDAGTSNLYWELSGEYMQPSPLEFNPLWKPLVNKTVPVPFGQWFTLDFFMKRGEGTAGQLKVSVQPDGGTTQVLFNTFNSTIYPSHPELYVHRISPFKLYLSPSIIQFMHDAGKNMDIMYNDFKWHKN